MTMTIPEGWRAAVGDELSKPYFRKLEDFLAAERKSEQVFPPADEVFTALALTPFDQVKVVILGQDPYHDDGQAHGLSFSVKPGIKPPPSLVNMYKEMEADLGCPRPSHGYLAHWARQGVLMLNAVLTVRAHTPNSHKGKGWEKFTDAVIKALSGRPKPMVFVLWGGFAQKKEKLIDGHHVIVKGAHPSPLSARSGFFGSKPFSTINGHLAKMGDAPIDWCLTDAHLAD
ncbi:MAG: uracil-DNA glycosylase [Myxococcales bacterium]|nr:uracil-DNA glycosylase [Myxococcales bacterium]MCB9701406.1 uracil-DNA glycosylase [Myxococcales bacterium]